MADAVRPRRARALSVLAAVLGALLVVTGVLVLRDGAPSSRDAGRRPVPPAAVAVSREPVPAAATSAAAAPRRGVRPEVVVVPALGVRAPVSPITTEGGALNPPSDPLQVGWWAQGARPGSRTGAAVLTGHTVHTGGGAFDDLEDLQPGDEVVVTARGRRLAYDVESVRVLSRAQLASHNAQVFGRGGPARLVLVTCEDWDGSAYRSNVVVTAAPAG